MWSRISRLSRGQLSLLLWFAQNPKDYATVKTLEKATKLKGKHLGGVISSLSRSYYHGQPIIKPWGRAESDMGLRWRLNEKLPSIFLAKEDIAAMLATYKK